ncbi:MAG: hypothetical protein SVU32_07400, partial [Candidatus Nanohaloarchaea archaeon]|nr:hypothetical protein [Candidatus Nanohaloarchaea archaeon]
NNITWKWPRGRISVTLEPNETHNFWLHRSGVASNDQNVYSIGTFSMNGTIYLADGSTVHSEDVPAGHIGYSQAQAGQFRLDMDQTEDILALQSENTNDPPEIVNQN